MGTVSSSVLCRRCKKGIVSEHYQRIGEHFFCLECARLPEDTALDERGCRFHFYYPVADLQGEYAYWSDAVARADAAGGQDASAAEADSRQVVNAVMIRTTEDPEHATDYECEWDVCIWIYFTRETGTWYFELREEYPSPGDAVPNYRGGGITHREAKEYLHRVGNHVYDHVLENV